MKRSVLIDGCILAFQFFSALPLKISVPWDEKRANWSVRFYPLIGLIFGIITFILYWLLQEYTSISFLALSILFLFIPIVLTGGLHIDGFLDCSDAYFSYGEKEKRLAIMKDSRIGAFGVLSLLVFLMSKWLFIYETIQSSYFSLWFFIFIPLLSRTWVGILFVIGQPAAKSGIAFEMKKYLSRKDLYFFLVILMATIIGISYMNALMGILFFFLSIFYFVLTFFFYKRNFGGITGDTLGAYIEGQEWFFWAILWVLHYSVMG